MAKHLMCDLETLAVTPQDTVLTLGAVHFNPYGNGYGDKLYLRINFSPEGVLLVNIDS